MLAYDYPLMGLFLTVSFFFLWACWLFAATWLFVDNFRRPDHSRLTKAAWAIVLIIFPLLGVFAYIVLRQRALDTTSPVTDEFAT